MYRDVVVVGCLLLLGGCHVETSPSTTTSSTSAVGGGGDGGDSAGGGGDGGTGEGPPGTCLCDPVPECSDPGNFTSWCGAQGPGPYAATACANCAPSECAPQPGGDPSCFGGALWCCTYNFNPPPQPKTFHCVGGVACEVGDYVFDVLCTYDENVTALTETAAVLLLLEECRTKYPQYSCGLWDLACF